MLAEERERVEGVRPIEAHLGVHFLLLADVLAKGCHLLGAKLQDGFPERADCFEVGALELELSNLRSLSGKKSGSIIEYSLNNRSGPFLDK